MKKGDVFIVDRATIIAMCVHSFKELIDLQLLMTNEVIRVYHEFYEVVGCIVHDLLSHELDVDLI